MSIQVVKLKWGRKRFVKTPPLTDPLEWMATLAELKEFLNSQTRLQLVGHKTYFELTGHSLCLMLEVVGVPEKLTQHELSLFDLDPASVFVHKLAEDSLFSLSFDELILTSRRLMDSITRSIGADLYPTCHIVFDNEKIELHFFRQKDYIQNLL